MSPSSARYSPVTMFDSVLLPAPFSPSSACTSPAVAAKSTPSFATTPGNRFVIPRRLSAGGVEGALNAPPPAIRSLALGGPDDPANEPVHRVQRVRTEDRRLLPALDPHLARLVVDRPGEDVETLRDDVGALLHD